ncbi:bifunctional diguanylate cyclase/phosphodiesterase [Allochromatium palmeri]|nr:LapD/MoxY N-terminal periplasmic domain-containing protein [Allochromatium palmeri]
MSLSKQLLILISVLFLLIFGGNFAVSLDKIRGYLQVESRIHAQDTATSLGLSLSPYMTNPRDPILATMIQAIYDMGYYKEIRLTDVEGRTLVQLNDSQIFEEVPRWFIHWLPMETATATSEISSGWNITGSVQVTSHPGYAYLKLYQQMLDALYYSLAALALSVLLLFLLLRFTLRPLKTIDRQAQAIAAGSFARIATLPWTTEVRNVARSMNQMSGKIEGVIGHLNQRLDALGQRLRLDELTGLYKKTNFETDMERLFGGEEGYVVSIGIDAFAELARDLGETATDALLRHLAEALVQCATAEQPEARGYRFHGAEFALVLPGLSAVRVEPFARALQEALRDVGERHGRADIAHVGIAPLNPLGAPTGILAAAQDACQQARLIGANSYVIRQGYEEGRSREQWHALVFDLIDQRRYQISYIDQVEDLRHGGLLMEEAFTQVFDETGTPLPIAAFVSMAERFDRIADLDRGVTERVVERLVAERVSHGVEINLAMATLRSLDFRAWLNDFLHRHPAQAGQLIFSITAYGVAKDPALFQDFIRFAHGLGARVLLKRYEPQFVSVEAVKTMRPDFIRLARDLTAGISSDESKRTLVEAIRQVGDLLDIIIVAENVQSRSDLEIVREIGLPGASH